MNFIPKNKDFRKLADISKSRKDVHKQLRELSLKNTQRIIESKKSVNIIENP